MNPVIANTDLISGYGHGLDACWSALLAGHTAIRPAGRFAGRGFLSENAATVPGLDDADGPSRLMAMLAPLLASVAAEAPADADLILATTTGEIDLLEASVLRGQGSPADSVPLRLLEKVQRRLHLRGSASVVSAACASSCVAIGQAAARIASGRASAVVVVAGDALSEFVFSGFSTLMALSPDRARPFDRQRDGLSLGEAAAWALVMDPERARQERRPVIAEIAGWGCAGDANHMTGPSRDGDGLARAIRLCLGPDRLAGRDIGAVCAHGTGTVYNDAMELKALRTVFGERPVPVFSVKGGTGHTLGAAGLLEVLIAAKVLQTGIVPPTPGLREPDAEAEGWVATAACALAKGAAVLSTNSGFGGVNAAVALRARS